MEIINKEKWDQLFNDIENPHILQSFEWGELKSQFGWEPVRLLHNGFIFQILLRKLPFGFHIAYIPKIDIDINENEFWKSVDEFCRSHRVIYLKIEQDWFQNSDVQENFKSRFVFGRSIQPRRTIEIDLDGDEDLWLKRMKSKTRYNIRLAMKKDVNISPSNDISTFYNLMVDTGNRDQFGVHSKKYYQVAYDLFSKNDLVTLLIATYNQTPLAGIMVFRIGNRSWYFYGASNNLERNRMPTYLLQFEAMKWAKSKGCISYDLWGIPDENEEILERDFENRSDDLWGVYRFKRGFGGEIKRSPPAYDRVYKPIMYKLINFYQKYRGNLAG